jgi:PAS domain S-box-containing protein
MEYRMIARDERVVWFLDHATVVPGRSGQAGFHHGFLLDITERKALEAELAEGTEQLERQKGYFESLLEISPVAIVTTDADDVVSSWNPAAERLFDHARREALGRTIDDLVAGTPELRAEAAMVNRDVRADGRAHAVTKRTHKDGSLIDVELLAAPVLVGREAIGTYAIYHDVSEFQRRRQYLESLLELSATAIVTVGLDDNVTSWDGAAETLFRYTRAARRSGATSTTSWLVSTSCGPRLRASPRAWREARRSSTRLGGPARTARWWMSTYAPRRSCWGWTTT